MRNENKKEFKIILWFQFVFWCEIKKSYLDQERIINKKNEEWW